MMNGCYGGKIGSSRSQHGFPLSAASGPHVGRIQASAHDPKRTLCKLCRFALGHSARDPVYSATDYLLSTECHRRRGSLSDFAERVSWKLNCRSGCCKESFILARICPSLFGLLGSDKRRIL